jgi:HEAT repeat protein
MADRTHLENRVYLFSTRLLGLIARVRPDERRHTLGAFLTLFGFMAGHALLETARDALFLASLPASLLPWVYLTIAAVALTLARHEPRLPDRFSFRNELSAWLMLSGVVTLGFWVLVGVADNWIFYALYVWSGVLATLVVVRFWTVLSSLLTVTQAKRLFAVIGSGSVLGAIVGSGAARILTELVDARHVVLSAGLVFLASAAGPILLGRDQGAGDAPPSRTGFDDLADVGTLIWNRPYLRRVAVIVLLSTVTFTLVDFVFKSTVARLVADDQLGAFFSSVYFTLNVVSLFVQIGLVAWLLRRAGVGAALALVPALLVLGAMGYVVAGGLTAVLLLKGIDGSTRYSLHRTGAELLFVPLSTELRGRVKAVIDVVGQRGGQALASLLILMALSVTTRESLFAGVAVVTAGLWLVYVVDLRTHYLDVFRDTLRGEITETRIAFPALDVSSLETLVATLSDPDDRRVVAALDLLTAQGKLRVIPALILFHPSPRVVLHAFDLFMARDRDDFLPIVERLRTHPDAGVRAASLRTLSVRQPDEHVLRAGLQDPAPEVRATALAGLVAGGWLPGENARAALERVMEQEGRDARLALALAARWHASPGFEEALLRLAEDDDPDVQLEAVRAMRAIGSAIFLPSLIQLLAVRTVRPEVRATFVGLGAPALARLGSALGDRRLPHAVRRHLPAAVGAFGTPKAAEILLRHLLDEVDGMIRFKILRALGKLRAGNPGLPLDSSILNRAVQQNLSAAFQLMRWRQALERGAIERSSRRTEAHGLLVDLIRHKQEHALERIFRLLNLKLVDEDFRGIHRGLQSARRESQAGSRELVENLVFPPVREQLLRLIDDLYDPVGSEDRGAARVPTYEEVLRELLESATESLSCLAAYQAGALRLHDLAGTLRQRARLSTFHAEVLGQAREAVEAAVGGTERGG